MELTYTIIWYLIFLGLNIVGLGISNTFFKNWFDKGYAVSKFVGFLAVTLPLWLLSSLHIVPFNETSVLIIYFGLLIYSFIKLKKQGFKFTRTMLKEEIMFLIIFVIWNLIRSTNARVEGTEKMMNIAFMNSINRNEFFPPTDMWFAGGTINYYYIGHYMYTFIAKLGNIPISYAYNFALNTIISYAFVASYSIILQMTNRSLKKWSSIISLGGSLWLCFGGTLQYFSKVFSAFINGESLNYWFPEATRTIPFAINEFPAYSIVLGDLHGHYIGFPFIVMLIAFLYISFKIKFDSIKKVKLMLLLSIPIVALYGINSWDFISANFFILLINFYQFVRSDSPLKEKIKTLFILETTLLLPGILFMLPYLFNFHPAIGGIGIVPLNIKRDLGAWVLMWGMFILITILSLASYLIILKVKHLKLREEVKKLMKENDTAIFGTLLTIAAFSLILGVEVFYIKDLFDKENPPYFRTNTVFKFYFAAWPVWVIACSYFANSILRKIYNTVMNASFMLLLINSIAFFLLFLMSFIYIFEAVGDFYPFLKFEDDKSFSLEEVFNGNNTLKIYDTIDGINYIKKDYPDDYAMIIWLNENVTGTPLLVEAVGDAYTYHSRISAYTGLPTVIGWPTHEWQWRGNIDEINARKEDIKTLYTTTSDVTFFNLIDKYDIKYIVLGDKERERYTDANGEEIKKYFKEVYRSGNSVIYENVLSL